MGVRYDKDDLRETLGAHGHGAWVSAVEEFIGNFADLHDGDGIEYEFSGLDFEEEYPSASAAEYLGSFRFRAHGRDCSTDPFALRIFPNGTILFEHSFRGIDSSGRKIAGKAPGPGK